MDLFRFAVGLFTIQFTVQYFIYFSAYLLFLPYALLKALGVQYPEKYISVFILGFHYYVNCVLIQRSIEGWAEDPKVSSIGIKVLAMLIPLIWIFGYYAEKVYDERIAYQHLEEVKHSGTTAEIDSARDYWFDLRVLLPGQKIGVIVAVLLIVAVQAFPSIYKNSFAGWFSWLYTKFQSIPILPFLCLLGGFWLLYHNIRRIIVLIILRREGTS